METRTLQYGSTAEAADVQGMVPSPGHRRAVALACLLVAAACVAAVGLVAPAPHADELEVAPVSTDGTRLSSSLLPINWGSHPGLASKLASADSNAWLHTSDLQLTALPKYDPDDDSDDQDKLAQANLDDEDIATTSLSSLPLETKALDVEPKKKYQNPDVAGLKALRNKVFKEDHPTQETESERENKIFAKAEQEEVALRKSLHEDAAAKEQKHAIATTSTQAGEGKKTAAQAAKGMDRPKVRVHKQETAQIVAGYEKGAVREEKKKLSALEERESLEQAMIDTETGKKKASLARIAAVKQQIERLESQKEHVQHEKLERQKEAAQHTAERAHQAKMRDKKMQSLELEMAAIKKAENARLAALSAKINSLGGKDNTSGGVAKPERARTHAAPVKEALSKLAPDEKPTYGILAPKSAAKLAVHIDEPKQSVFSDPAREEQLVRNIVNVNQLKDE